MDNHLETAEIINEDLNNITNRANKWLVTFSVHKTKRLTINTTKASNLSPTVKKNGNWSDEVPHPMYLGLKCANNLKLGNHINISIRAKKQVEFDDSFKV